MAKRASTIQEWYSLNGEELIQCPYQLGNLKITKSSCLKQRRRSDDWVYGTAPDNYVLFAFEMHLKVCKECDRVKAVAGDPAAGPAGNGRRFQKMGRPSGHNQRLRIKESALQEMR